MTSAVTQPMMFHGLVVGDWASWAQVAAIAVTGAAAVAAASIQLGAFNRNERIRNSIKIVDAMMTRTALQDATVSPLEACVEMGAIARHDGMVSRYRSFASDMTLYTQASAADQQWFLETRAKVAIAVSYLVDLGTFLSLKMLDRRFVMPKVSAIVPDAYTSLVALGYDDMGVHASTLRRLNDECVKFAC